MFKSTILMILNLIALSIINFIFSMFTFWIMFIQASIFNNPLGFAIWALSVLLYGQCTYEYFIGRTEDK
jgi:hypothetical protein